MNVSQIRAFSTVAQQENISKAAALLHVSQSSLSKQIARLEAELGVPLFDRNGKKITLNKAGVSFYESSSRILKELHDAEDHVRFLSRSQNHRIRIGACGIPEDFTACIHAFAKAYPATEFILNSRVEFQAHVDINDFDALICPEGFRFEKLSGYHLYDEGYYFAVPAKDPQIREKAYTSHMLQEQPLVFLQGDAMIPEFPYRICGIREENQTMVCFTDTREVHRKMISSGSACGFVPKTEAQSYLADKNIRLLPVLDKRFIRPMKICFLREKHLSELGKQFREFVLDYYRLSHEEE